MYQTQLDPAITTEAPFIGADIGKIKLVAGRIGGVEIAITNTVTSYPDHLLLNISDTVARALAQFVDKGQAIVKYGGVAQTPAQLIQLGLIFNKPATI